MQPLAFRMRPKSLDEVVGQQHILHKGHMLYDAVMEDRLFSFLLWGPPGTGKTSLANAIAEQTKSKFVQINAVSSGIPDLREIVKQAESDKYSLFQKRTILFIDEIHRFNKKQQDYLLPYVENGLLVLIGATTENPSFEVNAALLSRIQVFVLETLREEHIVTLLERALTSDQVLVAQSKVLHREDLELLASYSFGDARVALGNLERVMDMETPLPEDQQERKSALRSIIKKNVIRYDKVGEEHYNLISALHKSMRDSDVDASIYWTMRMVHGGEDPKFIVRRMIRFATEDIGLADPEALKLAIAVKENVVFVGMPESSTALVQLAVYLAKAPKSNACYVAAKHAEEIIKRTGPLEVPLHLRNGSTSLMKDLGYGKGYKYAHDYKDAKVEQKHLPDELEDIVFWKE